MLVSRVRVINFLYQSLVVKLNILLAATLAGCFPEAKRISQRTASYTPAEDKVLCEAWLEISSGPICVAEQKGFNYWRKVGKFFHEQRKICEKPFQSDRDDLYLPRDGASSIPSVAVPRVI
jgi:hypothetical protein